MTKTATFKGDADYSIEATGQAVIGDEVRFQRARFAGGFKTPKLAGYDTVTGTITAETNRDKPERHTFTILTADGTETRITGRNLYRNGLYRKPWGDEAQRAEAIKNPEAQRADLPRIARQASAGAADASDRVSNAVTHLLLQIAELDEVQAGLLAHDGQGSKVVTRLRENAVALLEILAPDETQRQAHMPKAPGAERRDGAVAVVSYIAKELPKRFPQMDAKLGQDIGYLLSDAVHYAGVVGLPDNQAKQPAATDAQARTAAKPTKKGLAP